MPALNVRTASLRHHENPDDKSAQLYLIGFSAETYVKHKVECFICGLRDSDRDVLLREFAKSLHADGWRYATSEKYQTTGIMCPKCAKTPDKDRL